MTVLQDKLNIDIAPSTPRRKRTIDLAGQLLTPTSSAKKSKTNIHISPSKKGVRRLDFSTPPTTPTKPAKAVSIYSKAKALFLRGCSLVDTDDTSHLPTRDREAHRLNDFFYTNIRDKSPNSLYISGPPGSGKSAQISVSFNYLKAKYGNSTDNSIVNIEGSTAKLISINCMSLNNVEHIFHEIYSQIEGKLLISYTKKKTAEDFYQLLDTHQLLDSVVVALDELDSLLTRDQHILFELFNCASFRGEPHKVKLILVGISNALDLSNKFLPRLKRNGLSPQSEQFLPYTAEQIRLVVITKLKSLNDESEKENTTCRAIPLFHPVALMLCCKKSASITGDLRKAFDICYKSIESLEKELVKKGEDVSKYTINNCPQVLISHVAGVCSNSFGENSSTRLQNLNLLQKAVLCCLINKQQVNKCQDLNVNAFFDFYVKHSAANAEKLLGILKKGEFLEILSALESSSVIVLSDKKEIKKSKNVFNVDIGNKNIKSNILFNDMVSAIGEVGVLKRLLYGK